MLRVRRMFLLSMTLFSSTLFAGDFEELAGDLPKVVSVEKSPYIVVADIFVPAGKAVRIEPGTVLLFRDFTGLHIQGVLTARGSKSAPITFTSVKDKMYNPQSDMNPTPFDWNGIYVHKDGIGTELGNFKIMYSVKGIVSETKFFKIEQGSFAENGRSNLTIEGEEKEIESEEYSYNLSIKDATVDGVPIRILQDPEAPKRNTIRYSGLALLVGGGVLSGLFGTQLSSSMTNLESLSSRNPRNLMDNDSLKWIAARDRRDRDRMIVIIGATAAAIGGTGVSWSFTF